jgi:uncharacterized membrane protein YphA (DoxX/SURF4 family)
MNWLIWILRLVAAGILLQTLYFKFTAQPESVYIFSTIGMEPWGRIGSGVVELIAGLLILYPRTTGIGALLSVGTLSGAIFFHLTSLGIAINGDSSLFYLAVVTWVVSAVLAFIFRQQIFNLLR